MSSRREEEKNEKIIRGLMKLPPNRRCINCNSLGPQYVCTNFWTFVCITCSGIHREFTHRVKSVSMAKFTKPEVEALQSGGNQRAREIFLPDWDFQRTRLPDSSNPDRIRGFIRSVYMEKKYAGGRSSDKPPRDIQTQKSFEEDHRRASSYHSYSQSPPYDYQYEDRLYGKQSGMLTRKPGSDRGGLGKISSLIYSPGREQSYEDRFSNEISGPRLSDISLSSASDSLKFEGQSPNFQKDSPRVSNPQQVRDILLEDGRSQNPKINAGSVPHPQRSASLGSLGSFAEKSVHSEALQPTRSWQRESLISSTQPSLAKLEPTLSSSLDFFTETPFSSTSLFENPVIQEISAPPVVQQVASLDLFAEINDPLSKPILGNSNPEPFLEKVGWATFDLPPSGSVFESKPTSFSQEPSLSVPSQRNSGTRGIDFSSAATTSQTWNAFDDSSGSFNLSSFETSMSRNEAQLPAHTPSALLQQIDLSFQKGFDKDGLSIPVVNDRAVGSSSFNPDAHPLGANSRESKSTNPFDISYDSDLEPVKFLDMNPLHATLPSVQFPPPFFNHLGQPSWSSYVSPVGHTGSLPYMAGQPPNSQLPDMPSQGPVSSLKGNPFD